MATHLAAFQASVDSATPTALSTVVDDVLTRSGTTRFLVPADYPFLRWALLAGANVTRGYVNTPSLQVRRMFADIVPHRRGTELLSLASPEIWIPPKPIELTPTEELEIDASEDAAGASQIDSIVALGPDTLPPVPDGGIRVVRCTAATALGVRVWTTVTIVPDQSLEPGEYALVGFVPISANILAARAIITGQVNRPGVPGLAGAEAVAKDFDPARYEQVQFYEMGRFTHLTIPQIQFWASVADAAETVFLYLVKTG